MIGTGKIVFGVILGAIICILASCVKESANNSIKIGRFENDVLQFDKMSDDQKSVFIKEYQDVLSVLNFSVKADSVESLPHLIPSTPVYRSFSDDVKNRFVTLDTLARELAVLKKEYETLFPGTKFPLIKTYITPYNQSVIITDTTLLIGLNHYLGRNHPSYGYYEEYMRVNKEPSRVIFDVSEALVRNKFGNDYNGNSDNTLLSDMLYEGFILYVVRSVLPERHYTEDQVMGYSKQQMEWCRRNESNIWNKIIGDGLLYSKSGIVRSKIMQPAPFTSIISMDSPGRIGRWIGLRIIESYAGNNKNKDIQLIYNDLKTKKSQMILMESRYDGK